jgi:hypothetical protein
MTVFFIVTNLSFIFFSVDQESRLVLYDKTFKVDTQSNTAITLWYVETPKSTNSVERANAELKRSINNLEAFNHFFEPQTTYYYNCRTVYCHVHQNK